MNYTAEIHYTPLRKDKKTRARGAWLVVGNLDGVMVEKVTYICKITAKEALKQWTESATMPTECRKVWK